MFDTQGKKTRSPQPKIPNMVKKKHENTENEDGEIPDLAGTQTHGASYVFVSERLPSRYKKLQPKWQNS